MDTQPEHTACIYGFLAHIGWQLASGLAAAADRNLVHGDFKATNVLISWNRARLVFKVWSYYGMDAYEL